MLNAMLWIAGSILLAGALVYVLRKRREDLSTTYVKTEENTNDNVSSQAEIEYELQAIIQDIKRKLKEELVGGGR